MSIWSWVACSSVLIIAMAMEPNPPVWPDSVKVFDNNNTFGEMQNAIYNSWVHNGGQVPKGEPRGRYSPYRYAFLFKPGTYVNLDAPMGYYVQIMGIGASPEDVVFEGQRGPHVPCYNELPQPGQLVTFWRAAERFTRVGSMDWFVSQAAPLRDLHITGDLNLHKGGSHGSGGYLGNSWIEGNINGGGQQQWFTRNTDVGKEFTGIAWNSVMVGVNISNQVSTSTCLGEGNVGQKMAVPTAPLVAEKPFISVDPEDNTLFNLNVPQARKDAVGHDFSTDGNMVYPFEQVYVTDVTDTSAIINAKLAAGLHVVVSPGIYELDKPLKIVKDNQVLLCLGLSTLLATEGNSAVEVMAGVGNVRVAGCLLEAGVTQSKTLMQWGEEGQPSSSDGSFMFDVFTRIGGPSFRGFKGNQAKADISIRIDADNVTADHLWLWRGDHYLDENVSTDARTPDQIGITKRGELHNANGLVVRGNHVRVYHLAVEHAVEDQVLWQGEDGEVYFFQSEIPYDVDQAWADERFVSYRVTGNVRFHKAYGIGTYAYFNAFPVFMRQGFAVPVIVQDTIYGPFVVKLSQADSVADNGGSGILSTINCKGPGVGLTGDYYEFSAYCTSANGSLSLSPDDTAPGQCPRRANPSPSPTPAANEPSEESGGTPWAVWASAWVLSLIATAGCVWVLAQRAAANSVRPPTTEMSQHLAS